MIIVRAPYRVSFLGGGTDFPEWYLEHGGAVLSATIDKYCYILVRELPPYFEHKNRVVWSHIELTQELDEIQHPIVKECLKCLKINNGVEIHHAGDLPARTGMGTSSAFAVALLHALTVMQGEIPEKKALSCMAYDVEHNRCKQVVGFQDQVAAAYGGLNRIEFGEEVTVKPMDYKLQDNVMLFLTGFQRDASKIEKEKMTHLSENARGFQRLYQMVKEGEKALSRNDIQAFGELVSEGWRIKKAQAPCTSTEYIDYLYDKGIRAGAYGGKLLGAGGGGVLCFIVPKHKQGEVKKSLESLIHIPVKFSYAGSEVIVHNGCS